MLIFSTKRYLKSEEALEKPPHPYSPRKRRNYGV
jgi:hypothetical protein